MHPFLILLAGLAVILVAIVGLRVHAFLALLGAAILVSFLAPGDDLTRISRVAEAFGRMTGSVGIVIALAAIVGTAMTDSGAADRIVAAFLRVLGEKRDAVALGATSFVLSLPVFFDTVFFLLAPLARSMHARTKRHYLKYLLAMCASGVATHTLVPPHPGPLGVADTLHVDLGLMILMGIAISVPSSIVGFAFGTWIDRRMDVPMRFPVVEGAQAAAEKRMPPLVLAVLPVVLPVILIATGTMVEAMRVWMPARMELWNALRPVTSVLGNPNFAMFISAALALMLMVRQRQSGAAEIAAVVDRAIMGAGAVILIVAAGGAFGAMLQAAKIGPAIQVLFAGGRGQPGLSVLLLAFAITVVIKVAQGSSTVAMITTAGMMSAMLSDVVLPFHLVYLCTAISSGSLVGSWMNDAGFWVFSRIGGVTELETLRSWTPLSAIVGLTSLVTTLTLATVLPLR